jgi:cysteine desulfurase
MSKEKICYLDNNATTRVAPEVIDAMLPFLRERWGNPSSAYRFGSDVADAIEEARSKVATLIGAEPREIVFTSCGTESNNAAIHSALVANPGKRHIVTTAVEHSAILKFCRSLEKRGYEVTYLPVESDGSLDLHLLEQSIRPDTAIVSVMLANNETGILFPIEEVAAICRAKGVTCHTDAVQTLGKIRLEVNTLGVDLLSMSAHKLHAPKGVGALFVRRRTPFHPYLVGGGQENGRRGGTENVPYIVAFGRAAELAQASLQDKHTRIRRLRDRLEETILKQVPHSHRTGAKEPRLPNTTNIAFEDCEAEAILLLLDEAGICASSGSACTTGSLEPSHVLLAMGLSPERARSCIRFSLGIYNSEADIEHTLQHLPGIIGRLRGEAVAAVQG